MDVRYRCASFGLVGIQIGVGRHFVWYPPQPSPSLRRCVSAGERPIKFWLELHIYDLSSEETPLPCLRIGDQRAQSRSEGIQKAIFLPRPQSPSSSKSNGAAACAAARILTGGNYGTIMLWTIPKARRRGQSMDDLNARCAWSLRAFASRGEGVCDMLCLPSEQPNGRNNLEPSISSSSSFDDGKQRRREQQPLVLLAGNGSSLALLDTSRVSRKAFSASVTPTLVGEVPSIVARNDI